MKIFKKLTSVLLCLTVLIGAFSVVTTASAAEIATDDEVGQANVGMDYVYDSYGKKIKWETTVKSKNDKKTVGEQGEYALYYMVNPKGFNSSSSSDYVDAYCIEPGTSLYSADKLDDKTTSATWKNLGSAKQKMIKLALLFGKAGSSKSGNMYGNDSQKWLATQLVVWEIVDNCRNTSTYACTDERYYNAFASSDYVSRNYNYISECMQAYVAKPSFAGASINITNKSATKSKTDENGVFYKTNSYGKVVSKFTYSKSVTGTNGGKVSISNDGNKLTVTGDSSFTSVNGNTATITFTRNLPEKTGNYALTTCYSSDLQDLIYGSDSVTADTFTVTVKNNYRPKTLDVQLKLYKETSDESISSCNTYSLEGATFDVYEQKSSGTSTKVCTLTTDAAGYACKEALTITEGSQVYAIETKAPAGFKVSSDKHYFDYNGEYASNNFAVMETDVSDTAVSNPADMTIIKKGENASGDTEYLSDAEFTVKFYDGYYSSASDLSNKAAEREWVFKTDKSGKLQFSDSYRALTDEGQEFYYGSDGKTIVFPLGTITIQETKAPYGYSRDDTTYICQIVQNSSGSDAAKKWINQPTSGTVENEYIFTNETCKIKLQIYKVSVCSELTDDNPCYNNGSMEGARYNIYTDENCTTPLLTSDGEEAYITLGSTGYGQYGSGDGGTAIDGGDYYCKETVAPDGFQLDPKVYHFIDSSKLRNSNIVSDGVPIYTISSSSSWGVDYVHDEPRSLDFSIIKKSSDGEVLEGAQFTVKYYAGYYTSDTLPSTAKYTNVYESDSDGVVYFDDDHFISGDDSWLGLNGDGCVPLGTVTIQETAAPTGYALDNTVYICQVKKNTSTVIGAPSVVISWQGKALTTEENSYIVPDNEYIKLQLCKTSSNTTITGNNSCYSLEGARYNIYTDSSCSDDSYFSYIVTDSDGYGYYGSSAATNNSSSDKGTVYYGKEAGANIELESGVTYYCKEVKAPKGYALNTTVYRFTDSGVTASDGTVIYRTSAAVTDTPVSDPMSASLIVKKSGATGSVLSDAQFTVKFYAGYYTASTLPSSATRSWVLRTDKNGQVKLDTDHKVSGSAFYTDDEDLPLGTVTIQETKAPLGYAIDSTLFICQIVQDGDSATKKWLTSKANVSNESLVVTDNEYIKLQLLKVSSNTTVTDGNSNYSLKGAVYNVYTNSSCTGAAIGSITTDSSGYGCYGSSSATNNSSSDKGATYYGKNSGKSIELEEGVTYYCKEVEAPKGYALNTTVYQFTDSGVTASDGATIYRVASLTGSSVITIKEPVTYGNVTLTKKDSSTKETLSGSQWQLYTSGGELVKTIQTGASQYMYNTSGTKTILDTDSDGELYVYNLPYGTYYFKETKAPPGYQISTSKYIFTVTAASASATKTVYNGETPGSVTLVKEDGNGSVLYGSQWQLYTKAGVPVLTYNTGGNGIYYYSKTDLSSEATTMTTAHPTGQAGTDPAFLTVNDLPKGSYYFIETQSPSGYMPYGKKIEFDITSSGTETIGVNLEVIDTKTMLADTGAGGVVPFYAAGAGFAALAAAFIIYHFKSKSQKRKENSK